MTTHSLPSGTVVDNDQRPLFGIGYVGDGRSEGCATNRSTRRIRKSDADPWLRRPPFDGTLIGTRRFVCVE